MILNEKRKKFSIDVTILGIKVLETLDNFSVFNTSLNHVQLWCPDVGGAVWISN